MNKYFLYVYIFNCISICELYVIIKLISVGALKYIYWNILLYAVCQVTD